MNVASLLYHDVVAQERFDSSGFSGAGADLYKLRDTTFREHLDALAAATVSSPANILDLVASPQPGALPWVLTFDDGGASARATGDLLAERGWVGHFFITGERIGTSGFVNATDLVALATQGHVIGAHSWSHPPRISALPPAAIRAEWQRSTDRLSEILGKPVTTASVPGGFYSARVADEARNTGVRILFNSEPVLRTRSHGDCLVVGRFSIQRDTPAESAAAFATGKPAARLPLLLSWNARKAAKRLGPIYEWVRERILERT